MARSQKDSKANDKKKPTGIEIRNSSMRISFMWRGKRYRETERIPPTDKHIRYVGNKRNAILYAIATNTFDYAHFFPNSKYAKNQGAGKQDTTVLDLAERFFAIKQATLSPQTKICQQQILKRCTQLLGEDRMTGSLKPEDIAGVRAAMAERYTVKTLNTTLQILRQFLVFMVNNDYNPHGQKLIAEARRMRDMAREPDPFTLDEYQLLQSCCRKRQDQNMLNLLVFTGIRPGELCALSIEDINLTHGTLRIRRSVTNQGVFKPPKTNRERTIDLYQEARACIEDQIALVSELAPVTVDILNVNNQLERNCKLHLLFPRRTAQGKRGIRDSYRPDTLRHKWDLWTRRAKEQDPNFRYRPMYQLRHTFASWNVSLGMDRSYLAKQMGHQSVSELERTYAIWMTEASQAEQKKMGQRMESFLSAIAIKTGKNDPSPK